MKKKLDVPTSRPLADFLPTITIKAKDLATEMTTFKTKEKGLRNQESIGTTHETHNTSVRQVLVNEGIHPEHLPREEDIKILERRIKREFKEIGVAEPKKLLINEYQETEKEGRLILRIPKGTVTGHLQELNRLLRGNPGDTEVVLELGSQNDSVRRLTIPFTVKVSDELRDKIHAILGGLNEVD